MDNHKDLLDTLVARGVLRKGKKSSDTFSCYSLLLLLVSDVQNGFIFVPFFLFLFSKQKQHPFARD